MTFLYIMDWITDLESTCASLGTSDGNTYVREEDCLECVKDLIRFVSGKDSTLFFLHLFI